MRPDRVLLSNCMFHSFTWNSWIQWVYTSFSQYLVGRHEEVVMRIVLYTTIVRKSQFCSSSWWPSCDSPASWMKFKTCREEYGHEIRSQSLGRPVVVVHLRALSRLQWKLGSLWLWFVGQAPQILTSIVYELKRRNASLRKEFNLSAWCYP